jgi:hypothetical protein
MDRSGGPARSPRTLGAPISRQSAKSRCRRLADTVAKVENRRTPKISRKSTLRCLRCCRALWDRYGGRWSIWCETMWSLTSPREGRTSEPEKFHRSVKKDFFNTIGTKRTSQRIQWMSAFQRGLPADGGLANVGTLKGFRKRLWSTLKFAVTPW